MKPSFVTNKAGVVLIDTLIFITLTTILIPIIYYLYFITTVTGKVNSAQVNLQLDGRRAIDGISVDTKQADRVLTSQGAYVSDADTLVLEIPAKDATGSLIGLSDIVVYDYDTASKQLKQHITPASGSSRVGGTTIMASEVDSLNFKSAQLRKDQVKGVGPSEICLQLPGGGNIGNVTGSYLASRFVTFPTRSSLNFEIQSSTYPGEAGACGGTGTNNTSITVVNFSQLPAGLTQNDPIELWPYNPLGGVGPASNLVIVEMTLKKPIGETRTAQVTLKDEIRLRNK